MAVSGDTIVVGAFYEGSSQTTITNGATASTANSAYQAGAAYVFSRMGTTWVAQAYLKAPNAELNDDFGLAVAVSGDTIVVGADREDSSQTTITNGATASTNNSVSEAGAAYVFVSPVSPGPSASLDNDNIRNCARSPPLLIPYMQSSASPLYASPALRLPPTRSSLHPTCSQVSHTCSCVPNACGLP